MSDLGNVYNSPIITAINGLVTDDSVVDVSIAAQTAFSQIEDTIGNLHGVSDVNEEPSRLINTIAGVLGALADEYVIPSDVTFNGYEQAFVTSTSKSFVLDLQPIPLSSITIDDSNPITWTKVASTNLLALDTDFCIVGRLITFHTPPTNFTVTYSGTFNTFGTQGYRPNVIPNQKFRSEDEGNATKPVITSLGSNRYNVVVPETNTNGHIILNDTIHYELSGYLQQYISPLAAIECPLQYLSIWKQDVDGVFYKVDCSAIYIVSETEYEFVTADTIATIDELAIVIANRGIVEDLAATMQALLNHSHLGIDGSSALSHSILADLIPVSDKPNVQYAGSNINGNDHPQYLNREGYTANDAGTYNNALLGDLLLASINPASLFNNVLSDSNIIYFGSTANGHSLKRRAIAKDLLLFSSENGLTIQYNNTVASNFGLNIADSKFRSTALGLSIDAAGDNTYFRNSAGVLKDISAGVINGNTGAFATAVNIANYGEINIGNISMVHSGTDLTIDGANSGDKLIFALDIEATNANIANLDITNINVGTGDKISFTPDIIGSEQIYFTSLLNLGAAFNSSKPLHFTGYGKNSGLAFAKKDISEVYGNVYVSSENGLQPTITDHNTYFESGDSDVYFLKDTTSDKIVDGVLYAWNNTATTGTNVANLKNWPKSNVHVNTINGSKFKFSQYNAMSYTGGLQGLNSNKTIINSDNGVLFTRDQSNVYNDAVLNKCDIEAKDVYANNVITNIITAETSNIKHISIPSDGTNAVLTVYGQSVFNAPVTISSTLNVNSTLTSSSIENGGNIRTNSMQVAGNISADTLSILNNVAFAGISSVDAEFSSLKISDKIEFTQTGKEIRMNNGAIIGLQMPSISSPTDVPNKGYVDALVSSASGTASGGLAQEIQDRIDADGAEALARTNADNTKANLAGSTTQVFSVAAATANEHAVRKEQLDTAMTTAITALGYTLNTPHDIPGSTHQDFVLQPGQSLRFQMIGGGGSGGKVSGGYLANSSPGGDSILSITAPSATALVYAKGGNGGTTGYYHYAGGGAVADGVTEINKAESRKFIILNNLLSCSHDSFPSNAGLGANGAPAYANINPGGRGSRGNYVDGILYNMFGQTITVRCTAGAGGPDENGQGTGQLGHCVVFTV